MDKNKIKNIIEEKIKNLALEIDELRQIAKHNFELAWNKEYLIKLFADHLVKGQ